MTRFSSVNQRARRAGAIGTFTIDEWRDTKKKFNKSCAYCGTSGDMQYDHIMPLHRGGTHYITNIVPCCAKCNERKHISTIDEWYKTQSVYDEGRYANILRHMSGL